MTAAATSSAAPVRLTGPKVEALKATSARREVRDADTPGLRMIVQPSGAKSWAFRYTVRDDKGALRDRKLTLGPFPALTVEDARQRANAARRELLDHRDPATVKAAAIAPDSSVNAGWHRYNKYHLGDPAEPLTVAEIKAGTVIVSRVGEDTAKATRSFFKRSVLPVWGNRPLLAIKKQDVVAVLDKLLSFKDARRKAKTRLHHFFAWSLERQPETAANPAAGIAVDTAPGRERVLTDDELRRVWLASDKAGYPFGPMVKVLILTMARRTEIASMQWSELSETLFTVPEGRSKNGVAADLFRTDAFNEIIAGVPRDGNGCEFVFTTRENRPVSGFAKMKARLDEIIGEDMKPWTLHDLRRTGSTIMQRLNISKEVIDACQNHKMPGVSARYMRYGYANEKAAAFNALASEVERIVSATTTAPLTNTNLSARN